MQLVIGYIACDAKPESEKSTDLFYKLLASLYGKDVETVRQNLKELDAGLPAYNTVKLHTKVMF